MLNGDNSVLRSVAWSEICPWLGIFRTFRLAISFRILLLSAVAALATVFGWALIGWVFSGDPAVSQTTAWLEPYRTCPWTALTEVVPDEPAWPDWSVVSGGEETGPTVSTPYFGAWVVLSRPLWAAFSTEVTLSGLACLVLCGLWSVAVWAFFGGAITRIAAVALAADEQVGWGAAIRHAGPKWPAYFSAPLFPVVGILLIAVVVGLLGLLLRMDVGVLLGALVWPLLLIAGLLMAILLLGLVFGWPLMWATISAEGTDSFDALSRAYAYVFQRPLHYLFYAVVAALFGALGWLLVSNFAAAVINLTYWAAGWGAGWDGDVARIKSIIDGSESLGGIGGAGATLIHFWTGCVKLLAVGFLFGYFWTASTAIYFLLRRDVDATEMDEVFLDEDTSEQTYGLPPIATDEAAAPVVDDDLPEVRPDDNQPDGNGGAT